MNTHNYRLFHLVSAILCYFVSSPFTFFTCAAIISSYHWSLLSSMSVVRFLHGIFKINHLWYWCCVWAYLMELQRCWRRCFRLECRMEGEGGGEAVAPGDSDTCSENGGANCEPCISTHARVWWKGALERSAAGSILILVYLSLWRSSYILLQHSCITVLFTMGHASRLAS